MTAPEWQRMRAGFCVQGPYRKPRRVMRWVLAIAVLIVWRYFA